MKLLYKFFGIGVVAAMTLATVACNDLSDLEERVDSLDGRVTALETQVSTLNSNIEALSAFSQSNKTISSVSHDEATGVWTLTLSDNTVITINQGSVGSAPVVSLDENRYWMVDYGSGAQYLTDADGNRIQAGVTPVFSVDANGCWNVSYDGGTTSTPVLGADGQPVSATGTGSTSFFSDVDYADGKLTLTLSDGSSYSLQVVEGFTCAIEGVTYGTAVTFEAGETKNYTLTLSGTSSVSVLKPEGWSAMVSENAGVYTLSVTAPGAATASTKAIVADSQSDVSVIAVSESGYVAMAKMSVELSSVILPATATATLVSGSETPSSLSYTVSVERATSWSYIHQLSSLAAPTASSAGWTVGTETTLKFSELAENTTYTLYVLPYRDSEAGSVVSASGTTTVAPITNYYEAFMAGKDIEIGGVVYNKSQFADTQIYHHTEGTLAHGTQYNNFIIFADGGTTITLGGTTNVIIVGANLDSKPTISMTASRYLTPSTGVESRLILKNIAIVPDAGFTNYMFTVNQNFDAQGAFGNFTIEDCDITMTAAAFYSISAARYLDKFVMQNCKVNVPAGTSNRFLLHTASATNVFSEITIKNNIFYCPSGVASGFRLLSGATNDTNATTVGTVTVENNTFVNVPHTNTSMIIANSFSQANIRKNLVFVNETANTNARIFMYANTYPTTAQCTDNVVYDTAYDSSSSQPYMRMFHDNTLNGVLGENPTVLSENPFDGGTFSLTTGEFVPNSTYSSYGAQR